MISVQSKLRHTKESTSQLKGAVAGFTSANKAKASFTHDYNQKDPRSYLRNLGALDYIIPDLAKPVFDQLIIAWRAQNRAHAEYPVNVWDFGCSYGFNGALLRQGVTMDQLRRRYESPGMRSVSAAKLVDLDRFYFASWPTRTDITLSGIDIAANAVNYGLSTGLLDHGYSGNLERQDPDVEQLLALGRPNLIVSTGVVGYISAISFRRALKPFEGGPMPWIACFVLRSFPFDGIEAALADFGLVTEKLQNTTFIQRRFRDSQEATETIQQIKALGIDPAGLEENGCLVAELYLARPQSEIDASPLASMIRINIGANRAMGSRIILGSEEYILT